MDRAAAVAAFAFAHPFQFVLLSWTVAGAAFVVYWLYHIFIAPRFSSLRVLRGPKPEHPVWGNTRELLEKEPGVAYREWTDEYGGAVRYRSILGEELLLLTDTTALNYVLNSHVDEYPKPPVLLENVHMLLGKSVGWADGDAHRRQRRLMAPAFTPGPLKAWVPMFFNMTYELRDIFRSKIETGAVHERAWPSKEAADEYAEKQVEGEAVIDVTEWMQRLSLDTLGKSALGYDFEAMALKKNGLATSLYALFSPSGAPVDGNPAGLLITNIVVFIIRNLFQRNLLRFSSIGPIKEFYDTLKTLEEESSKVIQEKIDLAEDDPSARKRDLLSILTDPAAKGALSAEELRAQLKNFVFAGHDTVSATINWTLWWLSTNPEKQERVRKELRDARSKAREDGRDELTADEMYNLPYLDAVMREVLRLEPTVTTCPRVAKHDDLIPLANPVPSAADPSKLLSHVPVKAGQRIEISLFAANMNKAVFGEDVDTFRPERWLDAEKKIEGKVGVYSGMMTFLHGQRACIGWKFGMYQMKAILSVLLDDFEFRLREDDLKVAHRTQMITRPFVVGEEDDGQKLPLRITLAR
ncbi:hypothetical protein JCM10213_004526 [Rhodosporidiobolus nylandii]